MVQVETPAHLGWLGTTFVLWLLDVSEPVPPFVVVLVQRALVLVVGRLLFGLELGLSTEWQGLFVVVVVVSFVPFGEYLPVPVLVVGLVVP